MTSKSQTAPKAARRITAMNKAYMIAKSENGKHVDVDLYGEVVQDTPIDWWTGEPVEGLYISLEGFLKDLEGLKGADTVTFRINSIGGDVSAGLSIYNRIRALGAQTTTIVDGLAASAASVIAQAGDVRKVSLGAQTMIHGASTLMVGYYNDQDLKRIDEGLQTVNQSLADLYAERTGKGSDEILQMMQAETWMTPDEAVENGFADEVIGREEPIVDKIEGVADALIVNGVMHRFGKTPLPQMPIHMTIAPEKIVNGREPSAIDLNNSHKEGGTKMTLEELRASSPELEQQIRDEATATACAKEAENVQAAVQSALEAERTRIREIDSIAKMVGDPALVDKAKYEEPMDAKELAYQAMQAQQAAGNTYMTDRAKEMTETQDVTVTPNGGMEDEVAENEKALDALVARVKEARS